MSSQPALPATRPNVVYIHSHDTGRYIQPYGYAVPTPRMQRLAEEGVLFRQNFCAAPTCSPSRAALLTGTYPHVCGQIGLVNRGVEVSHPEWLLAWTMRQHGYRTALMGIQHVVKDPATAGYEVISGQRAAADAVPAAVDFLAGMRGRPEPFFLDVGFTETHRVFHQPGPQEDPRYCRPPAPLPDTPETRQDMAAFMASARVYDWAVGEILDALHANGFAENTLVINTTDHGIAFPNMKCHLTDHGIGVMLIMRGPRGLSGGKVVDAMVSHVDVFPTVCDVAGVERPAWLQGASLLPLVNGQVESVHDAIFAEVNYHAAYEPQRVIRTGRWAYIRRYVDYPQPLLANCDDGPSKEVWQRHGWADRPVPREQLCDLVFDPNQVDNLAADPACAAILDNLRARLDRWMEETDDPLRHGHLPPRPGAVVNLPEDLSPRTPPGGGLSGLPEPARPRT